MATTFWLLHAPAYTEIYFYNAFSVTPQNDNALSYPLVELRMVVCCMV